MLLNELNTFSKLQEHFKQIKKVHMRDMFEKDELRFKRYFLSVNGLKLDYSKNRIDDTTMKFLIELANECELKEKIQAMFRGDKINTTENRSVLHIALRNRGSEKLIVDGVDIMENVRSVLKKMEKFTEQVSTGSWLGYSNHFISDIVNIGIGGSDLGALMVCKALKNFGNPRLNVHFVSNVDSTQLQSVLSKIHPQTTLFIIASKTFSTQETLANALAARKWFLDYAINEKHIAKHFVAVSTNKKAALDFGIAKENIFEFWNWVGGRYSLWCSVGLAIMLYLGKDNFYDLLEGAYLMDKHFYESDFEVNMPVILALLGIWYINFFEANTHLIMPYDEHLRYFPKFIQQLDMESNGKSVSKDNTLLDYHTGAIIWGDMGINAQHAFFQLLHQGTWLSPIDFIAVLSQKGSLPTHHEILLSNVFAQSQAFMKGKNYDEVCKELKKQGLKEEDIRKLAPHKVFTGNRVSNTILLDELNPRIIGSLIALYEHKIFVQGSIWNINSFDQWGVELGKELSKSILAELLGKSSVLNCDSSTRNLINLYKEINQSKRSEI